MVVSKINYMHKYQSILVPVILNKVCVEPVVVRERTRYLDSPYSPDHQPMLISHWWVFVKLSCLSRSLWWLTAQKYTPSSWGSRFFTVNVPLSATVLVAENFSSLKLPKSCLIWPLVVKTMSFIVSPGSCLYQYIWKYKSPLVWLQSIVAFSPIFSHKKGVWVTSLPVVKPEYNKKCYTPLAYCSSEIY